MGYILRSTYACGEGTIEVVCKWAKRGDSAGEHPVFIWKWIQNRYELVLSVKMTKKQVTFNPVIAIFMVPALYDAGNKRECFYTATELKKQETVEHKPLYVSIPDKRGMRYAFDLDDLLDPGSPAFDDLLYIVSER